MLTANQLRQKYLDFFALKGHEIIPSSPLVPENDPTTLFTSSGMQPLIRNLLGESHPSGTRLVDSQKCFRSQDIEEVGDNRHTTFFEMLGNWSLGDYFKKEQLPWFFEFLIKEVGLDPKNLYVTVFSGDKASKLDRDEESIEIWKKLFSTQNISAEYVELDTEDNGYKVGMKNGRIFSYGVKKNWWSRSGIPSAMPAGEPGGPDSEVFYDFGTPHDPKWGTHCHPNCDCGRFLEIGNSVFMQYQKQDDGSLKELPQKNVDFGGGFSRILAASRHNPDIFLTDLYAPLIDEIAKFSEKKYDGQNQAPMRVIADHLVAAVFLIADGVIPSNKTQGYFLRRLLRRAMVKMQLVMGDVTKTVDEKFYSAIISQIIQIYKDQYFQDSTFESVEKVINDEKNKFGKSLQSGLRQLDTTTPFDLFQTYGFPIEVTEELYKQQGKTLNREKFEEQLKAHQDLSRSASKGMFKGGLEDQSEVTTKYHTATHLLQAALRQILGTHVSQKGSNITAERLRFDFSHTEKMTPEQIKSVEDLINQKIAENIPVVRTEMNKAEAIAQGAMAFFPEKYPDVTSVYTIGSFSKELCGGPHVNSTGDIGGIKIIKEESASSGVRRIYAQLI